MACQTTSNPSSVRSIGNEPSCESERLHRTEAFWGSTCRHSNLPCTPTSQPNAAAVRMIVPALPGITFTSDEDEPCCACGSLQDLGLAYDHDRGSSGAQHPRHCQAPSWVTRCTCNRWNTPQAAIRVVIIILPCCQHDQTDPAPASSASSEPVRTLDKDRGGSGALSWLRFSFATDLTVSFFVDVITSDMSVIVRPTGREEGASCKRLLLPYVLNLLTQTVTLRSRPLRAH